MKKIFIACVCLCAIGVVHAEQVPMLISAPIVSTVEQPIDDEMRMCTMDYTPVCGVNGTTYGNACGAGKNKIAYKGECDIYIDAKVYTNLELTKTETLKRQLSRYSQSVLASVLTTIDQRIATVKFSRIAHEMQVEKITLYTFVKNTIPAVLQSRTPEIVAGKKSEFAFATYMIDGESITLNDGKSEIPTLPGSASKTVTRYFGNEARGDLNGDGTEDRAFLLTQETGGSGLFYYAVAALSSGTGYKITNAIFLGDRIAPQTTEILNARVVVNYADRKENESMTSTPTLGVSKYLKVANGLLGETK